VVLRKFTAFAGKTKSILAVLILPVFILQFNSCSSVQNAIFTSSIDPLEGPALLEKEPSVRAFLENIVHAHQDYSITAFERTGLRSQFRRTRLLTHSFFVIANNNSMEDFTLSFYGSNIALSSEGVWVLNAYADMSSYIMYRNDDNRWDVTEIFQEKTIDTRQTLKNVIARIDKDITWWWRAHISRSRPYRDNCNTALQRTIVFYDD